MTSMPTTYDSGAEASSSGGATDASFVRSLKGILRIVESIVALIAFICAAVGRKGPGAGGAAGWCMFVSMFSCLLFLITFFLWLFRVFPRGRAPIKFIEYVMYIIFTGLYLIAGIVAAAFGSRHGGMGAAAFFLFAMMVLCAVDVFFHFQYWRSSDEGPFICGKAGSSSMQGSGVESNPDARGVTY